MRENNICTRQRVIDDVWMYGRMEYGCKQYPAFFTVGSGLLTALSVAGTISTLCSSSAIESITGFSANAATFTAAATLGLLASGATLFSRPNLKRQNKKIVEKKAGYLEIENLSL